MRVSGVRAAFLAAAALALLASAVACEDSALTVPSDGTVLLRANPSTVVIDANQIVEDPPGSGIFAPQTKNSTQLTAQAFNADGKPLQNVTVSFGTGAGTLASGGQGVKTDATGEARDTLTISRTDPTDIQVTATSSSVSTSITVKKLLVGANQPPTAVVVSAPRDKQAVNEPVIFDGTSSLDPDDDLITMYRWTVNSTNPDAGRANPYVVEDPGASALELIFQNVQNLSVTLQVTDNPDAQQLKQQGLPVPYSPFQDVLLYEIQRCAVNEAPVASIEGTDPIQVSAAAGQNVTVPLNGSNSSDPEQFPLDTYTWTCGNNSLPQIQGQPQVACTYRVQSVAVEYTATLVVTDRGATGQIDPVLGTYCDQKSSTPATRKIRVSPLQ
jgi:hypothetical protein